MVDRILAYSNDPVDIRRRVEKRWAALHAERAPWFSHWQDITRHLLPRSGRYFEEQRNDDGAELYNDLIDNTATRSLRELAAGMTAGASSPSRPWFRLKASDPDLNQYHTARVWLDQVRDMQMAIFAKANTYRSLYDIYETMGGFGQGVNVVVPDMDTVIHHHQVPIGEYCVAIDKKARISTLYRRYERTVAEVVEEFGYEPCSQRVKELWDETDYDQPVEILHAIEPRRTRNRARADNREMPFASVYLEIGSEEDKGLLRESGFPWFPVLAPRWGSQGYDAYGYSPGMEVLGDIRQLQMEQVRKNQVIDHQTMPALQVPTQLAGRDRELYPGGINFFDQVVPQGGIRPAWEVNMPVADLREDILDIRERIKRGFFSDLFVMLANAPPTQQLTATEVLERHDEKLLQLGPVIDRVNTELLAPLIYMTYAIMDQKGLVPPIPEELVGKRFEPEFVSVLAQAQRMIGMNSTDRFMGSALSMAELFPEIKDKIDIDAWVDVAADRLGVDPTLIRPTAKALAIRQQRQQQEAQMAQAEQMAMQAKAAKDLAAAPTSGDTALSEVMNNFAAVA